MGENNDRNPPKLGHSGLLPDFNVVRRAAENLATARQTRYWFLGRIG